MSNEPKLENKYDSEDESFRLLKSLKQTVEWLLASYSPNVWNTYGSLPRLRSIIDEILSHGLRYEGPQKYWKFLCGLRLLKPELGSPPFSLEIRENSNILLESQLCNQWLEKSLLEHNISLQLQMLLQDKSHVLSHYKRTAFLLNKTCTDALLLCLRAVEHNQPALLADLDPTLIMKTLDQSKFILNAPIDIPSARKEARIVCDNVKEVFETSSSLDYVTPPESATYLYRSSKTPLPHSNLFSKSFHEAADVNGNHVNLPIKKQEPGQKSALKCTTPKHTLNSSVDGVDNASISSSIFTERKSVSSDISDMQCSTLLSSSVNIASSVTALRFPGMCSKRSSSFRRCASDPIVSKQLCESVGRSYSIHNLSNNVFSDSGARSQRTSFISIGSSVDTEWQVISDSMTVCDISSYLKKTVIGKCDRDIKVERAIEAKENSSANVSLSSWKAQHSRSKSDGTGTFQSDVFSDETEAAEAVLSASLPSIFPEDEKQKIKSIFEDEQVVVPTECFFPKPQPGQTLTGFLSSNDFNICAELDKENAHFCIAEALISAIEHIKCTQALKFVAEEVESDEEIKTLTQRIRIRRREKMREKEIKNLALLSDGRTNSATSQSASPKSSTHSSDFEAGESIGSDEDVEDIELSDQPTSNLSSVKESGLSLSMASLYSDADFKKATSFPVQVVVKDTIEEKRPCSDNDGANLSAEAIALSLLKRFSEKQIPKATDLQWLVSEQEVPQRLLPLPDSWPVSPDSNDEEYNLEKTRLRGNLEWAPPRRQIIFFIQPDPKRKAAIQKQNYRCAGCGMKIEKSYAKKFRYCDYLGKFFCQCCHSNNLSHIPGRILWKWDFKNYYVSKFAWKLLDQMHSDPLFNVLDVNPNLYRKVRQLDMCRESRIQLFYLKDFIKTCRKATAIQKELDKQAQYMLNEPHLYSISDFVQVKSGKLSKSLSSLVSRCVSHVTQCVLCYAKGFICEMCDKAKDVIFPFQLTKVCLCPVCGSCFHKKCYKPGICPKCTRITERKKRLSQQDPIQSCS